MVVGLVDSDLREGDKGLSFGYNSISYPRNP